MIIVAKKTLAGYGQLTFIHDTKQPNGSVENNAIDIQQTVLNVNRHLKCVQQTSNTT